MTDGPPPVVVVGASAGGVEALRDLVSGLPADLPACVLVVLHVPPGAPSALPAILRRTSALTVRSAADGEPLAPATVLVGPADHHLLVLDGRVGLSRGPQENGHRPAVDVLFRSAARALGPRVMAVVLSGTLDDGAAGSVTVASRGGRVLVQHAAEALFAGMPSAAHDGVPDAVAVSARDVGSLAAEWAASAPPAESAEPVVREVELEVGMAAMDPDAMHDDTRPGRPAGFGCPDCAGALFEIGEGPLTRFRCRVGHAWSPETLLARQAEGMESALWMALRSLEEKSALNADLARRAAEHGQPVSARRFGENAEEALRAAELVRRLLTDLDGVTPQPDTA